MCLPYSAALNKKTTLSLQNLKMVLHKAILGLKQNMGSTDRTSFVYEKLLEDISKRWDPASLLLGMAAIANPRHKSLEWMKPVLYVIHCSLFIEMSGVIGLSHENTDASSDELHEDNLDCDFLGDYDNDDDRAGETGQAGPAAAKPILLPNHAHFLVN